MVSPIEHDQDRQRSVEAERWASIRESDMMHAAEPGSG
jgi:hypothetical protein